MQLDRREFTVAIMATCALPATHGASPMEASPMYGLIGKMAASPGQRDALIAILLEGTEAMPGCLSYIVAKDVKDENAIWITEVWDRKESHAASLSLPVVKAAIAKARPLIAGFSDGVTLEPVGGVGLPR